MHKIEQIKEKSIIVQSNEIVEANYRLNPAEQKLILALISKIDTRKNNFELVRISAKSLSDACGFNSKSGYRQLQKNIKQLLDRTIILKKRDGSGWYGSHWLQCCEYVSAKQGDNDCSYVEIEFDRRLCPHFLNLKNRFLEIGLNHLITFSHNYSIRFYMIFRNLTNNLPKCIKKYTFGEIIKMFKLPKSYEEYTSNIKNKVIKLAIDDINKKSDIVVEYKYYSEGGRAHIGVIFTIWRKTDKKQTNTEEQAEQPQQITSSTVESVNETDIEFWKTIDDAQIDEAFANFKEEIDAINEFWKMIDEAQDEAFEDMSDAILEWTPEPEESEQKKQDHSAGQALLKSLGVKPPSSSATIADATEKKKEEPAPAPADDGNKGGEKWTAEQQADYDELLKYGVWVQTAEKFVATCDHALIKRNIQGVLKTNQKGNIRDLGAVLTNAIVNDTYKEVEEENKRRIEREQARRKAEWEKARQDEVERQALIAKERAEEEDLAKIREQYTADELNSIMEQVKKDYNNNGELTREMKEQLKKYGINTRQFYFYRTQKQKFGDDKDDKRTNKLTKVIAKDEIPLDFEVNLNDEKSVEKIIKLYYQNGKKCPDNVLKKLNEIGYNWNDFARQNIHKIIAIGKTM